MSFRAEFGSLAEANAMREEYAEHLCSDDDRRLKTVEFASSSPEELQQELQHEAATSRAGQEGGAGQIPLTDAERKSFDFSREGVNVLKLRSVKAIADKQGVDDWRSYFDPTLEASEHWEVMERAARDEAGQRMDAERSDEERAADLERQAGGECDHAEAHCEHGDPDACEFLSSHCGFSDEQVSAILDEDGEDLPGPVYGALAKQWTRYKAGLANAKEAAAVINEIHRQNDQELVEFEQLGARTITKEDITW